MPIFQGTPTSKRYTKLYAKPLHSRAAVGDMIMIYMQNRKMPTTRTAWLFLGLSAVSALLFGLQPMLLPLVLAITFSSVGLLSIPRMTYPKVLLLSLAAGLLSAVPTLFLRNSIPSAIAAFAFAPATALLVLTIRRRYSRNAGIIWVTVLLSLTLAGALLLWLYGKLGSFSMSTLKQYYNEVKVAFVEQMLPLMEQNSFLFTDIEPQEAATLLFNTLLTLLPGLYICGMWMIAWISTVCIRLIFKGYVYGIDRFAHWPVTASRPFAWIYLISFLLSVLPLEGYWALIPIVANNLYLIFLPTFVIIGCRTMKEMLMRTPGCGCLPIVLLSFMFMMLPGPIVLLSFMGAFRTVSPARPLPPPPFDSQHHDQGGNPQ